MAAGPSIRRRRAPLRAGELLHGPQQRLPDATAPGRGVDEHRLDLAATVAAPEEAPEQFGQLLAGGSDTIKLLFKLD